LKFHQTSTADFLLRSPIDIAELRDIIQQFTDCPCSESELSGALSVPTNTSVRSEDIMILVVEDSAVNNKLFVQQLMHLGFPNVHSAHNGVEAINMARINRYTLIVMDCQMPVMDGHEATRVIREMPAHATTPIVALTADHSTDNIRMCSECGMSDFFTKPVSAQSWQIILNMAKKRAQYLDQ
jgi:CheY-like chemotaxis protein